MKKLFIATLLLSSFSTFASTLSCNSQMYLQADNGQLVLVNDESKSVILGSGNQVETQEFYVESAFKYIVEVKGNNLSSITIKNEIDGSGGSVKALDDRTELNSFVSNSHSALRVECRLQ